MPITGLYEHIKYQYPDAVYSEVLYLTAEAGVVERNMAQEGAIAVLTHYVYWHDQDSAALVTFFDQYGQILFSQSAAAGRNLWAPIVRVNQGPQLRVTCAPNTVDFSVSYQYLMWPNDKNTAIVPKKTGL